MPYQLLTGATGLLGAYLLRDLLRAGGQVAVVARPSNVESARQRVESIMARWERGSGKALPRPPVLAGDICEPGLGLGASDQEWVRRNCGSVLHNAASLTFQADPRSGEPRRSNVDGTRHVLDLCRRLGIREFHHVSTAYVCGLRRGKVLESELDAGQQFGNDYERTKVEAETMVRAAGFLDAPTVYRPAIIIGDSTTGYTTTYHGFYTPLKIAQALVDRIPFEEITGKPLLAALGLSGEERKNFVPVDWVSRVIVHLAGRAEHRGKTYHLTPGQATPVGMTCDVIEQALREYVARSDRRTAPIPDLAELQHTFQEQMEVYRAYWRDDPEFDARNTATAAPHLPCPDVDFDLLLRTSRYALNANFGWPRPRPVVPRFDVGLHLSGALSRGPQGGDEEAAARGVTARVGLQVNGPGGGQWTLLVDGVRPVGALDGLSADCCALLYMNSRTFQRCVNRELSARQAVEAGRVVMEGNHFSPDQLQEVLQAAVLPRPALSGPECS